MKETAAFNRRKFLKVTGITGAAFVLGLSRTTSGIYRVVSMNEQSDPTVLTPYILIDRSGKITLMNPRPEIGQGTYQSIPALIAEELEVSLEQVEIRQTQGEPEFGMQMVGGSASVRRSYTALRQVGASAREMLISAAAMIWNVPESECFAENAHVFHLPTERTFEYGEIAADAAKLDVPENPVLKDPRDFKILGKDTARPDIPLKTSGKAVFGIDFEVPGMLYASVEHCPVFGARLLDYEDGEALKVPGVVQVVKTERVMGSHRYEGIAVLGENYWSAFQGRKALTVEWDYQGYDSFNSEDYEQQLRDLSKSDGITVHDEGDFDEVFNASANKLEAFYETPVVSHSPMEPMNCLAWWKPDDTVEIWASSQGQSLIKGEVSRVLGIPSDKVIPHIEFVGGGFGRRLLSDYATEAAMISRTVEKPVKMIWTREDDTQLGPFRPMTFSAMKGALGSDGRISAFQHKVISPSNSATMNGNYDPSRADRQMVEGISDQEYRLPNMKNAYVYAELHIPMAAWRSVTSSTVAFPHECFIDELAVLAGADSLQYRLDMLSGDSNTYRILTKLREFSGWDKPLPEGWGRGVAQYEFFAGQSGQVVEVSRISENAVKIEKVYAAIDLGTVVNPDNVKAQVEGAIVMALTAATKSGIRFEQGKSVQTNFHNNPLLRINEMPRVEVLVIADGGPQIRGVGEPGLPPLAPALCNAIFNATGIRIRKLPFDPNNLNIS